MGCGALFLKVGTRYNSLPGFVDLVFLLMLQGTLSY